jgi:hypothetical protein
LCADAPPRPFVHPGVLQSREDLEFMKKKVAASKQPWKHPWENLLRQPGSSLEFKAKPVAHIVDERTGAEALAIEILNAWSGTLWDFEGNDAKLLAARKGVQSALD